MGGVSTMIGVDVAGIRVEVVLLADGMRPNCRPIDSAKKVAPQSQSNPIATFLAGLLFFRE